MKFEHLLPVSKNFKKIYSKKKYFIFELKPFFLGGFNIWNDLQFKYANEVNREELLISKFKNIFSYFFFIFIFLFYVFSQYFYDQLYLNFDNILLDIIFNSNTFTLNKSFKSVNLVFNDLLINLFLEFKLI